MKHKTNTLTFEKAAKQDILELEAARAAVKDDFVLTRYLKKASINNSISDKKAFLRSSQQVRNLKNDVEVAKLRKELKQLNETNKVKFEDLY